MAADDAIAQMMGQLKDNEICYLRFELPDLHGVSRTKVVPIDKVEGYARRGLNLYGSVIGLDTASNVVVGCGLHNEINYKDQMLFPDPATLQMVPWLDDTAKVICDAVWSPGEPVGGTPRTVLQGLIDDAADMGFDVMMGHEFEFYLLDGETKEPLFGGLHIFNSLRNNYVPFLDGLLDDLEGVGVDVITHNCEYSPSQFEINFGPGMGLAGADKAFTFKNAVKELAHRAGYLATFMSKPASDMSGSGCHVHMSLIDKASGESAFFDPAAPGAVHPRLGHFTEGMLAHAKAMMPLIGPTPNCYRRLKPHTFAPSNISWGIEDRSALVRVKDLQDHNAHAEMRAASGLSNPYLSAAAVLAAGLLGIKAGQDLRPGVEGPSEDHGDLEKLPGNLEAALDGLEADQEMCDLLGADFVKVFTTVKRFELARFHDHVSDWERTEYMEVY
ncbi:MAG: glutamine synthetase family protein [Pseudomonadota bacterium]